MDSLYHIGIQIIQSIQTLSPALDGLMGIGSSIGLPEFFLVLIPFIYWNIDRRVGIRAMFVMFYFDFMNASLKVLLHEPRPFWLGGVRDFGDAGAEGTYGLPSGHSGRTFAVAGYLATQFKKNWFWAIAIIYVLFVGISRMYLGVHFPHDVLGGWLLALLTIWAVRKWEGAVREWLLDKSLALQIGLGFVEALGMVLIGFLVRFIVAGTPDPAEWSPYNADARTVTHFFTIGGAIFGAYAGYAMMRQYALFSSKGAWGKRILRFVVGIAGILALFYGLDTFFATLATDESTLGYILRFVRYATVTFGVSFLAPWIFIKTNLAEPED